MSAAQMLAIDPEGPGGPEVLTLVERPAPMPEDGEVLIEVAAAGVNRPDVVQRLGLYPPPPGAPGDRRDLGPPCCRHLSEPIRGGPPDVVPSGA